MSGVPGKTHCGRWIKADPVKHGTARLVCSKPAFHGGVWHYSAWSGWMWPVWKGAWRTPVRDWVCNGWVDDATGTCRRSMRGTEDEIRVKGWKIGHRNGIRDPLCPQCAKPDPVTAALARDLERSLR